MTLHDTGAARRTITAWNHVRAIALLPLMNVILIPSLILALTRNFDLSWAATMGFSGLIGLTGASLSAIGLSLAVRSIAIFVREGDGTLAPWDPTQRLVVGDVYGHMRNPMKAGLFLTLIGETLALQSAALAWWTAAFVLANVIYIRISEEPGLRARFGSDYARYCERVPRWWPRLTSGPRESAREVER